MAAAGGDAYGALCQAFPHVPKHVIRAELDRAGGEADACAQALLDLPSGQVRTGQPSPRLPLPSPTRGPPDEPAPRSPRRQ